MLTDSDTLGAYYNEIVIVRRVKMKRRK